jgi:hypothetical protein
MIHWINSRHPRVSVERGREAQFQLCEKQLPDARWPLSVIGKSSYTYSLFRFQPENFRVINIIPGHAALILPYSTFKRFDIAISPNVCAVNLRSFGTVSHLRVHRDGAHELKSANSFTFVCSLEARCEMYCTWPVQYRLMPYTVLYCYLLLLFVTAADSGSWRTSRHNSRP